MKRVTGNKPAMWGSSIVGFGTYHYQYPSGREGDAPLVGFSPRKGNLTVYVLPGVLPLSPLLAKLGKHKTGKGCLYIKRLADVDVGVLEAIIDRSVKSTRDRYGSGVDATR